MPTIGHASAVNQRVEGGVGVNPGLSGSELFTNETVRTTADSNAIAVPRSDQPERWPRRGYLDNTCLIRRAPAVVPTATKGASAISGVQQSSSY